MLYAFSLPWGSVQIKNNKESVQAWCDAIVKHMKGWPPNHLRTMVEGLLKYDPNKRLSAVECLKMGYDLKVFTDDAGNYGDTEAALQNGNESPRRPQKIGQSQASALNWESDVTTVRANPITMIKRMEGTGYGSHNDEVRPTDTEMFSPAFEDQPKISRAIKPLQGFSSNCAQSNDVTYEKSISSSGNCGREETEKVFWTVIAENYNKLEDPTDISHYNEAYADYRINADIFYTAVDNAITRGLLKDTTKYFYLPFPNGKIKIRKRDCRLQLSESLIKAGVNGHIIAKGSRKKLKYHRNHIPLKKALEYAIKKDMIKLRLLLEDFMTAYRHRVRKEDAPSRVYEDMSEAQKVSLNAPISLPTSTILNPDAGMGSRSFTGACTATAHTISVFPCDNTEDNRPRLEVIIEDDRAEHIRTSIKELYQENDYPKARKKLAQPSQSLLAEQVSDEEVSQWEDVRPCLYRR